MEIIQTFLTIKMSSQPEQVPLTTSLIRKMMKNTFPLSRIVATDDYTQNDETYLFALH